MGDNRNLNPGSNFGYNNGGREVGRDRSAESPAAADNGAMTSSNGEYGENPVVNPMIGGSFGISNPINEQPSAAYNFTSETPLEIVTVSRNNERPGGLFDAQDQDLPFNLASGPQLGIELMAGDYAQAGSLLNPSDSEVRNERYLVWVPEDANTPHSPHENSMPHFSGANGPQPRSGPEENDRPEDRAQIVSEIASLTQRRRDMQREVVEWERLCQQYKLL